MLPDPDTLNNLPFGKFVLANLAAKRAEQLSKAARPLLTSEEMSNLSSPHPLTIALAEIALGKIKPRFPDATSLETSNNGEDISSMDVILNPSVGTLLQSRIQDEEFEQLAALEDLMDEFDKDAEELESESSVAPSSDPDDSSVSPADGDDEPGLEISLDDLAEQESEEEDPAVNE